MTKYGSCCSVPRVPFALEQIFYPKLKCFISRKMKIARKAWVKTIRREDWNCTNNSKICSRHFIEMLFILSFKPGYYITKLRPAGGVRSTVSSVCLFMMTSQLSQKAFSLGGVVLASRVVLWRTSTESWKKLAEAIS